MLLQFSPKEERLHNRALVVCRQIHNWEYELVNILREIDEVKLFKKLEHSSLFQYAVKELGLAESIAYCYISVARKIKECPQLAKSIESRELSVSKASRIVRALTSENQAELIAFAAEHTSREIDFEVARRNPQAAGREMIKPISGQKIELRIYVSHEELEVIQRAQSLLSSKVNAPASLSQSLVASSAEFVEKHDPVKKAERAMKRKARETANSDRSEFESQGRQPLKAGEKHSVYFNDRGRCTHIGKDGKRCTNDRWLQIHHIKPVSEGGGNHPSNLTTLCWFHHDLIHQMSFPELSVHEVS